MRAIILTPVRFAKSAKHLASIGPSFPDPRAAHKVAYRPLSTVAGTTHDVCFWHKRGKADMMRAAAMSANDPKRGHEGPEIFAVQTGP